MTKPTTTNLSHHFFSPWLHRLPSSSHPVAERCPQNSAKNGIARNFRLWKPDHSSLREAKLANINPAIRGCVNSQYLRYQAREGEPAYHLLVIGTTGVPVGNQGVAQKTAPGYVPKTLFISHMAINPKVGWHHVFCNKFTTFCTIYEC